MTFCNARCHSVGIWIVEDGVLQKILTEWQALVFFDILFFIPKHIITLCCHSVGSSPSTEGLLECELRLRIRWDCFPTRRTGCRSFPPAAQSLRLCATMSKGWGSYIMPFCNALCHSVGIWIVEDGVMQKILTEWQGLVFFDILALRKDSAFEPRW